MSFSTKKNHMIIFFSSRYFFKLLEFKPYEPNFNANKWEATTYVLQADLPEVQGFRECLFPVCSDRHEQVKTDEVAKVTEAMVTAAIEQAIQTLTAEKTEIFEF